MQQEIIKVEDSKYALFLQLLQSLDYVKVVSPATDNRNMILQI